MNAHEAGEFVPPEEAARLLRDATPGPWRVTADTPWGTKVVLAPGTGEFYLGVSAHTAEPTDGWSAEARARAADLGRRKCQDARLIAAAPRLAATVAASDDLRAEVERLREALRIAHMHALQGGYDDPADRERVRQALGKNGAVSGREGTR